MINKKILKAMDAFIQIYNIFCNQRNQPAIALSELTASNCNNVRITFTLHYWHILRAIENEIAQYQDHNYKGSEIAINNRISLEGYLENSIHGDDKKCVVDERDLLSPVNRYELLTSILLDHVARLLFIRTDDLNFKEINRLKITRALEVPRITDDTFEHEGSSISDPYASTCLNFEVDPISKYGIAYFFWYNSIEQ